jgi:hypothetical protein
MANEYPKKSERIKQEYNLPPTTIQANAIVEEYGKTQRQYKEIREAISYLIAVNTVDKATIKELFLEKNILRVSYQNGDMEKLETYIKKEFRKSSLRDENGKIIVRIEL